MTKPTFDVQKPPGEGAGFKPKGSTIQILFVPANVLQQQGQTYVIALVPRTEIDSVIDKLIAELEAVRTKAKELLKDP